MSRSAGPPGGMPAVPRVAVVGGGIAGMGAALSLAPQVALTLFEAERQFGGHAHTVDLTLDGVTHGVDTGFLVFNHRTYPRLTRLFDELGVATAPSDMSFSVQVPQDGLEWSGSNLRGVFAQPRNALRPAFWGLLAEVLRFNRLATALAQRGDDAALAGSVGAFLDEHRFGPAFRDGYFLPMIGCIWSCPVEQMLRFPVATLIRFCHNHGLLQISDRPQWHTVRGGSRQYVRAVQRRLAELGAELRVATPVRRVQPAPQGGAWLATDSGREHFDAVVLASHSDQSLALLGGRAEAGGDAAQRALLAAIRYQPNRTLLHTDARLLPRARAAWAAWNYARASRDTQEQARVGLHYLINRLQPLPWRQPVIVSLNPDPERLPAPGTVAAEFEVSHPVFDTAALRAQQALPGVQGRGGVWLAGAWAGYGFHEDGLRAGQLAAAGVLRALGRDAAAEGLEPQAPAVLREAA